MEVMPCRVTFGPEFIVPGSWRRLSPVYREKANNERKDMRAHQRKLRDMFKCAYPAANITADGLPDFSSHWLALIMTKTMLVNTSSPLQHGHGLYHHSLALMRQG